MSAPGKQTDAVRMGPIWTILQPQSMGQSSEQNFEQTGPSELWMQIPLWQLALSVQGSPNPARTPASPAPPSLPPSMTPASAPPSDANEPSKLKLPSRTPKPHEPA